MAPSSESNHSTEGQSTINEKDQGKDTPMQEKQTRKVEQTISRKIINPFLHNIIRIMNSSGTKEDIITSLKLTIRALITIMDDAKIGMNQQKGENENESSTTNHGQHQQ